MKIQGIFAASSPKDIYIFNLHEAFFYALQTLYLYSCQLLVAIVLIKYDSVLWRDKGVDNFFFMPNFHFTMPKNNEIRVSAKYSSIYTAPNSATTVSIEKFNIEMNAKNRAYTFILSSGLLNEFAEFCDMTSGLDLHDVRVAALERIADERLTSNAK